MGVFSKNNQPDANVNRNAFDGSFQNNLTMKMGYLYPCLCKEVVPGDTFRINAAFGLRFMPTAFPIQTKLKAHIDLFYCRDRNLWKGFQNYYTQVGSHDGFPILSPSEAKQQCKTGELGDYLGLPSTISGSNNFVVTAYPFVPWAGSAYDGPSYSLKTSGDTLNNLDVGSRSEQVQFFSLVTLESLYNGDAITFSKSVLSNMTPVSIDGGDYYLLGLNSVSSDFRRLFTTPKPGGRPGETVKYLKVGISKGLNVGVADVSNDEYYASDVLKYYNGQWYIDSRAIDIRSDLGVLVSFFLPNVENTSSYYVCDDFPFPSVVREAFVQDLNLHYESLQDCPNVYLELKDISVTGIAEATSILETIPFDISALPFRAYEQIYNSFYRDDRNNPLYVDGVFDPNRFIPNDKGGIDGTPYRLRKRNWEQDFLTTALPSPQFGNAPLVGITSSGVATFSDADGHTITSQLSTDADGDTVVGFSTTSDSNVNNTLIKLASSGISINDLRGVNSLQRYLETKYRLGLRYRDQIRAHYAVDIKQDVLDMPEFIGSITQMVDVSQINQTSPSGDDPLGSYAGQLSCVGGRDNGFQKYCDEPGYIIGIISVVPVPCYSQLLPKHFLKTHEPLDFFFPEFNHLGFQPIKYSEVCPFQAALYGKPLNSTFGYQRAWYDYLSNVDEIHGQFRTTLNNFILTRTFNTLPSLNEEFLTIDPSAMNDIFTVNEVNGEPVDTILGQIHFDITMMRPISRYGTPRLE